MLNRLQGVFSSFHSHDVRYVVIGGIAAVLHGVPRATFDLDILIEPTEKNAAKLLDAYLSDGPNTQLQKRQPASTRDFYPFRPQDENPASNLHSTPGLRKS